jgi:EmrB/QacA subfamily drug resistance transporter
MTATEENPPGRETEAPETAPRVYTHRQIRVIMSGLVLGMLLAALDGTIVATALTTISRDFHRADLYSWVITSYLLTSTVTTPLYGKVGDLYGRKRIFMFAIVVFLVGSALCGLSQNMFQLIAFRGVQGLGAGGLMALAMAIVGDIVPLRQRGRYQGYFGATFGTASIIGPLIGGFLVDEASWRWVFYVNLPIGLIALAVIQRVLQLDYRPRRVHIDWFGAVLLVTGVSLFLVGVQNAGSAARVTSTSVAYGTAGLVLVVAFCGWETRAVEPVLPLRLFRSPIFTVANAMALFSGAILFGALIFLPQYLQIVRHVSPTVSGLRLVPILGGMIVFSITSGLLITRRGRYKRLVVIGSGVFMVGVLLFSRITVGTSPLVLSLMLIVVGAGSGLFSQTLVLAAQNSVDRADLGVATSTVTFFRTLGGAVGASVLGAILVAGERSLIAADRVRYGNTLGPLHAYTSAMDRAYTAAWLMAVAGFAMSFFLRERSLRGSPEPAGASEADPSHRGAGVEAVANPLL